jgi:ribose 5-phosphate isomerase A
MSGTANPRGGEDPLVTEEGYTIIDVRFYEGLKLFGEDAEYSAIAAEINTVEGVVTHGLFLGLASAAVVAREGAAEPEVVELQRLAASG